LADRTSVLQCVAMGETVFIAVLLSRLLIPLAIPRFPIPAILAALVIDAADQTIFDAFDAEPANYQGYDKALDIYYLTIAYVSTIRNWTDGFAFRTGQFLWYYRLFGVVAFELTEVRALLLIFPNTFEYFFIFYEGVRLLWNPHRLSHRNIILAAAGIWVFIKLPQEWWIHIAQLDFTDFMDDYPWMWGVLGALVAGALVTLFVLRDRIPKPDWPLTFDVDEHRTTSATELADPTWGRWALLNHPLFEKTALVSMVTIIFVQVLPDVDGGVFGTTVAVMIVVVANAFIGYWLAARGTNWRHALTEFLGMGVVNVGVVGVAWLLLRRSDEPLAVGQTLFLVALLTLIVTLYDRYRLMRLPAASLIPGRPRVTP
jgi:hypothetical protein